MKKWFRYFIGGITAVAIVPVGCVLLTIMAGDISTTGYWMPFWKGLLFDAILLLAGGATWVLQWAFKKTD